MTATTKEEFSWCGGMDLWSHLAGGWGNGTERSRPAWAMQWDPARKERKEGKIFHFAYKHCLYLEWARVTYELEAHCSHFVVNFEGKRLIGRMKNGMSNFPGISYSEDWKRWQIILLCFSKSNFYGQFRVMEDYKENLIIHWSNAYKVPIVSIYIWDGSKQNVTDQSS